MSEGDRYADLPLPDAWMPVLDSLRSTTRLDPVAVRRQLLPAIDAPRIEIEAVLLDTFNERTNLIDTLVSGLDAATSDFVFKRYAQNLDLAKIFESVETRKRRGLENMMLRTVSRHSEPFIARMKAVFYPLFDHEYVLLRIQDGRSTSFPQASATSLWHLALNVYSVLTRASPNSQHVIDEFWLLSSQSLRHHLDASEFSGLSPRFTKLGKWISQDRLDPATALAVLDRAVQADVTASNKIKPDSWTRAECLEALAHELNDHGFFDWHFSQIAKAAKIVFPERFRDTPNSRFAGTLISAEDGVFQFSGRKGYWKLAAAGDGYSTTEAALVAILQEASVPLHAETIYARLKRDIPYPTMIAVLNREPAFNAFGDNFFGLPDQHYDVPQAELDWLRKEVLPTGHVVAEDLYALAERQYVNVERLKASALFASDIRFVPGNRYPATYQTLEVYAHRRLKRWRRDHFMGPVPEAEVIEAGLARAFETGDVRVVVAVIEALSSRGVHLTQGILDMLAAASTTIQSRNPGASDPYK